MNPLTLFANDGLVCDGVLCEPVTFTMYALFLLLPLLAASLIQVSFHERRGSWARHALFLIGVLLAVSAAGIMLYVAVEWDTTRMLSESLQLQYVVIAAASSTTLITMGLMAYLIFYGYSFKTNVNPRRHILWFELRKLPLVGTIFLIAAMLVVIFWTLVPQF